MFPKEGPEFPGQLSQTYKIQANWKQQVRWFSLEITGVTLRCQVQQGKDLSHVCSLSELNRKIEKARRRQRMKTFEGLPTSAHVPPQYYSN